MSTARLLSGSVAHLRHAPFRHRFAYRLFYVDVDVDHPPRTRLFGPGRAVSVAAMDHGPRDGSPLRPWAEGLLGRAGLGRYAASIRLVSIPRILGYAFNPIALYLCHDIEGRRGAVIAQVKNTFGDQHAYVLPAAGDARATVAKRLHVSPFLPVEGGYAIAVLDRGDRLIVSVRHHGRLTATMALRSEPLTDRALLGALARMPLMSVKVFAAIHWHGLRLWLRGARYHPRPEPPADASTVGRPA